MSTDARRLQAAMTLRCETCKVRLATAYFYDARHHYPPCRTSP